MYVYMVIYIYTYIYIYIYTHIEHACPQTSRIRRAVHTARQRFVELSADSKYRCLDRNITRRLFPYASL